MQGCRGRAPGYDLCTIFRPDIVLSLLRAVYTLRDNLYILYNNLYILYILCICNKVYLWDGCWVGGRAAKNSISHITVSCLKGVNVVRWLHVKVRFK